MSLMVFLTTGSRSGLPSEVISPAMYTILFLIIVSQATLLLGSSAKYASNTASDIWSQTLSGCPPETDSDVKI